MRWLLVLALGRAAGQNATQVSTFDELRNASLLGGVVEVVADIVLDEEIELAVSSGANFSLEIRAYGRALACGRPSQHIFRVGEGASLAIRGGSLGC